MTRTTIAAVVDYPSGATREISVIVMGDAAVVEGLNAELVFVSWDDVADVDRLSETFAMLRVCEFKVLVPLLAQAQRLHAVNSK
jgi:hypothetical protein